MRYRLNNIRSTPGWATRRETARLNFNARPTLANFLWQGYKCQAMSTGTEILSLDPSRQIWERLVNELGEVFDAHGVCAAAANVMAMSANNRTLVAISDPVGNHFDVWLCNPDGQIEQDRWSGKELAFERFHNSAIAKYYDKFEAPPKERMRGELWNHAKEKILAVPIPYPVGFDQVTPPGAICLIDPKTPCPIDEPSLATLAALVSTFLDRAFLRQKSDQQEVEFGIISEISTSLTSTLNLEEIFIQVTDAVRRVLGAESLTIGLTDPNRDEVVFLEALMGPAFRDMPPVTFKIGQGIAGWVAQHGQPAIVNDAYADQRFSSKVDRDTGYLTNSVLCVPLKIERRVIGVLEAINKQTGRFDENDSRLLQAICGPLAIAIENALLHSDALSEKRRIETIFASMSDGLLTVNASGRITTANDALIALLGGEPDIISGKVVNEVIYTSPDSFPDFYEHVLSKEQDLFQLACDLVQGNGTQIPVLISGTTVDKDDGSIDELIFVFSDLSQIREVERMRNDFFHNIVHELRTPLATILMYARLLREGKAIDDPDRSQRFLGVIERESDRLQKMVRQMLQLAKLEASQHQKKVEITLLNPIFEQVLPPLAERAFQKGLLFNQVIQPNLPAVMVSEDTLYMIIKNLVENSIKFTPSGSVSVEAWLNEGLVCLEVKDEGIGIPKEAMPNLFQRFYRARSAVERGIAGTGLGLYMVKEGLETYGGSIEVDSQEGKGTTFLVSLPPVPLQT